MQYFELSMMPELSEKTNNVFNTLRQLIYSVVIDRKIVFHKLKCNCSEPILVQCHISIPPENVKKPLVFWRFQRVYKCDTGLKLVKK